MNVIKSEKNWFFDIDFTLLMWGSKIKKGDKAVLFTDPYSKEQKLVKVNEPNLKILTSKIARGATVFIWSQSGHRWAFQAMRALGFGKHPQIYVLGKPDGYVDDKPCKEWMGERVYLPEDYPWR